jgi:hypothetical protein
MFSFGENQVKQNQQNNLSSVHSDKSVNRESIDYANYLLELTKEKRIFIQEHKYRATVRNLNIEKVQAQLITQTEDKKEESSDSEEPAKKPEITVSKGEREAANRGNGYKKTEVTKEDITQLMIDKSRDTDKAVLRKWADGFLPALQ